MKDEIKKTKMLYCLAAVFMLVTGMLSVTFIGRTDINDIYIIAFLSLFLLAYSMSRFFLDKWEPKSLENIWKCEMLKGCISGSLCLCCCFFGNYNEYALPIIACLFIFSDSIITSRISLELRHEEISEWWIVFAYSLMLVVLSLSLILTFLCSGKAFFSLVLLGIALIITSVIQFIEVQGIEDILKRK